MTSAFGIEHTVSKSFRKLAPKLVAAEQNLGKQPVSAGVRRKENYAQWRVNAGKPGSRFYEHRVMDKEGAQAMVTAAGNSSRRTGRKLS